jgi:hypothetical protein
MFRPRLKTIEQTADQTVLRENPVYVAAIFPIAISLLPIAVWVGVPESRSLSVLGVLFGLVGFTMFFATGLSALVTSTFCISRASGTLRIKRKLLWWAREKEYFANDVLTVFEDHTIKGNRLMMRLRSGQVKRFTIYAEYAALDAQAGIVNSLLHEARLSGVQSPARNPLVN